MKHHDNKGKKPQANTNEQTQINGWNRREQ